jgi:hypothetical protein
VVRRCVWSRNIKNMRSIYIYDISSLRVKYGFSLEHRNIRWICNSWYTLLLLHCSCSVVWVLASVTCSIRKTRFIYLPEKYFCFITVYQLLCFELCTGQNGAQKIPAEHTSWFASSTSWILVTLNFYFHCLKKTYFEQKNGHTITHSFHFSLQFCWHTARQVTPCSPYYEI